ncbi:hypothetical protein J3R83DRAFT_2351 [Lanmaoa asiatica]|nr:hypothetical protein J3R83DRAFT_2351 [Lanmaoa asiatica]
MSFYVDCVSRDLRQIVECVVTVGRLGLPYLTSTSQVRSTHPLSRSSRTDARNVSLSLGIGVTDMVVEYCKGRQTCSSDDLQLFGKAYMNAVEHCISLWKRINIVVIWLDHISA